MVEVIALLVPAALASGVAGYALAARVAWPVSAEDRAAEDEDARQLAAHWEHVDAIKAGRAAGFVGEAREEAASFRALVRTAAGGHA